MESDGKVTYTPTVQGQNDNMPVTFTMTSKTDDAMTFENPEHDYPKKIVYRKVSADSLVAEISGVQQGKPSSERYPMRRKAE